MLAGSAEDASEAIGGAGRGCTGIQARRRAIQIHKSGDQVAVYSRRLNDVTAAVPEVVELVRALPARELILDGEVIALRDNGTPHAFQTTMSRFGKRLDVNRARGEVPLTPFFFDLLHLDGGSLMDEPARARLKALHDLAPAPTVIPRLVTASSVEADRFLRTAIERGHEGIMAKALDAPYQAGHRGRRWLKVKPANTLDLVVLAAEWGHGRRHGWLSNLHLGARNPEGGFVMLGKTFKGMTDEMLDWQTKKLLELEVARDGITVYVRPELVVEVAFNEVQASTQYPGGVALRFARIKRYRTDKTAAETDTIGTVQEIIGDYRRRITGVAGPNAIGHRPDTETCQRIRCATGPPRSAGVDDACTGLHVGVFQPQKTGCSCPEVKNVAFRSADLLHAVHGCPSRTRSNVGHHPHLLHRSRRGRLGLRSRRQEHHRGSAIQWDWRRYGPDGDRRRSGPSTRRRCTASIPTARSRP